MRSDRYKDTTAIAVTDPRLLIIPKPQPDQTVISYASTLAISNGLGPWKRAVKILLGTNATTGESWRMAGIGRLYRSTQGADCLTFEQFAQQHAYLSLFFAFFPIERMNEAYALIESGRYSGMMNKFRLPLARITTPVRQYCLQCIQEDLLRLGFAYARRAHQVNGVKACVDHRAALIVASTLPGGMVDNEGVVQIETMNSLSPLQSKPANDVELAYARWVVALLEGRIGTSTSQFRSFLIEKRIEELGRTPNASLLESMVIDHYGEEHLTRMGFSTRQKRTEHWPAFLAQGGGLAHHPICAILVLSMLWDDPAQFAGETESAGDAATAESKPHPYTRKTFPLNQLKFLFREPHLKVVARRLDVDSMTLHRLLATMPKVAERRPAAVFRTQRRNARRIVLRYVESEIARGMRPSKRHLKKTNRRSVQWLLANDREWIDAVMPSVPPSRSKLREVIDWKSRDRELSAKVEEVADSLAAGQAEPRRITKSILLQAIGSNQAQIDRFGLEKTRKALAQSVESADKFHQRVLAWLKHLRGKSARECINTADKYLTSTRCAKRRLEVLEALAR